MSEDLPLWLKKIEANSPSRYCKFHPDGKGEISLTCPDYYDKPVPLRKAISEELTVKEKLIEEEKK